MARQVLKIPDLPPEVLLESEATLLYLPLSGGTVSGTLIVGASSNTRLYLKRTADTFNRMELTGSALRFGPGDAVVDTELIRAGVGALNLLGHLWPGEASTYDLGDSGARWRKVWTGDADLSGALTALSATVASKAVAASPDGGNSLEWRTNGFYAGGGGGGSFSSVRDEEFAPAAAATTVTLAATPTNLMVVARNGVIQSQAAGNYSLAGSTITFTDAFVAGERVSVVYEIGVAAGDLAYTKNDSDTRFVNVAGDTMTGNLQVNANVGVGVAPAAWRSDLHGVQLADAGAVWGVNGGGNTWLSSNTFVDAAGHKPIRGGEAASYLLLSGGALQVQTAPAVAAGAAQTFTTRLTVNQTGTVTLTPDAGQDALVWAGGAARLAGNVSEPAINTAAGYLTLNPQGGAVTPPVDGYHSVGSSARKWGSFWGVTGTIQTSHVSQKHDFALLDPAACAEAVIETDWLSFAYNDPAPPERRDGVDDEAWAGQQADYQKMIEETAPSRLQKGFVLGSDEYRTAELFGQADRRSASPSSDLAVVACALQAALQRLAALERHVGVEP